MTPYRALAMAMMLAATAIVLTPSAAAIDCEEIETVDDVRECRDKIEDAALRLVGAVLYEACHVVDPQRCP